MELADTQLREIMKEQPYYKSAKWSSFQSWLTKTIRKAEPLELNSFIKRKREALRMQARTWFKALVTDEAIDSERTKKTWVPNGKLFNPGSFRELRTELALVSLKAEGKIKDFYPATTNRAHDALGVDFWVELEPKGFFRRVFPIQIKSSEKAAKEFENMRIHYSQHFKEMMNKLDPQMVQDFDSLGFDGNSTRTIPVIIAKDKSITDLKQEVLDLSAEMVSAKKCIHQPRKKLGANNAKPSARRIETLGRHATVRKLFSNDLLAANAI